MTINKSISPPPSNRPQATPSHPPPASVSVSPSQAPAPASMGSSAASPSAFSANTFEAKEEASGPRKANVRAETEMQASGSSPSAEARPSGSPLTWLLASSLETKGLSKGKGLLGAKEAERAVEERPEEDKPMNFAASPNERAAELKRLTQVDGAEHTWFDQESCGPHCLVVGLYLQDPQALSQVAAAILQRPDLDKLSLPTTKEQAESKTELLNALTAIKEGKASPLEIARLSQFLTRQVQRDPKSGRDPYSFGGTSGYMLRYLAKNILKEQYGVDVPPMRLQLVNNGGSGHWVAHFLKPSASPPEEASKERLVAFDPWPTKDGYAPVFGVPTTAEAEERQTQGGDVVLLHALDLNGFQAIP